MEKVFDEFDERKSEVMCDLWVAYNDYWEDSF